MGRSPNKDPGGEVELLVAGGREVPISNPGKVLFPEAGHTKLDLARYYLAVAEGALRGAGGRPNVLVRYPNGIKEEFFYQKRAPTSRPPWIEIVSLKFPSGRSAEEVVPREPAALAWLANLACLELHPHPVRAEDLDHPDELRVDLDPVPGVEWDQVRQVALVVQAALAELGLTGWPKTSGSRGHPRHRADRAALELRPGAPRRPGAGPRGRTARAQAGDQQVVEGRAPRRVRRLQPERQGPHGRVRLFGATYPDARVSAPLSWDEVPACDPAEFTLVTMPKRFATLGDRHAGIDAAAGSLESLLELSVSQEKSGLGDAPWPPHYRKQEGEPTRVQPSKARAAKHPLITIGHAKRKEDALAGLERWKTRHPKVVEHLEAADVLVDSTRGRYSTWTRIRVNLQHVPPELRPAQEPLDPDEKTLRSS